MEDEIDLRVYLEMLLRNWKWIALCVLAGAIAALVVTLLVLPPVYQASAVVMVRGARYEMEFDSRLAALENRQPAYKAFPQLAASDNILSAVIDAYNGRSEAQGASLTLGRFKKMIKATSGGDPSLIALQVRADSAQAAATLANLWSDALVRKGNTVYGETEQDVTFFEEQLASAQQALDDADAALIEFEARNQSSIVTAKLDSSRQAQVDHLSAQRTIVFLTQDIRGLRTQLAGRPGAESLSLADDLTSLFLQIKAFNVQAIAPIQLQIDDPAVFQSKSRAEQVAFLDSLLATLEARSAEIEGRRAQLEPEILALQGQLQQITAEGTRLTLARTLAEDTYSTLAQKLEESRIGAQQENGMLAVGSYATRPAEPVGPSKVQNTVIGAAAGLLVGLGLAIVLELARKSRSSRTAK